MTAKLTVYNDALLILGAENLASLSESSTARLALDAAYDLTLRYCLERGYWNFAMRAVEIDSSASVDPAFGWSFAFTKPSDFIRLYRMSAEQTLTQPLLDFTDEPNYWFANCDPLYAKYVSDDIAYGGDLSLWSESFADYFAKRLAVKTCRRITGSEASDKLLMAEKQALAEARSKDAMDEPPGFPPAGSWVTSRGGASGLTRSRWNGSFE